MVPLPPTAAGIGASAAAVRPTVARAAAATRLRVNTASPHLDVSRKWTYVIRHFLGSDARVRLWVPNLGLSLFKSLIESEKTSLGYLK